MTCAVSAAVREGASAVICASTGNTAASAAAYAARARMTGAVIVPEGKIATGKLAQALMHGAKVIAPARQLRPGARARPRARGQAPDRARQQRQPVPARRPEDRGLRDPRARSRPIDALCIPVGNAGNITAYWKGFTEEIASSPCGCRDARLPGRRRGAARHRRARRAARRRVASAIRIGNPARWEEAMTAMRDSRGGVEAVTDEQILDAYRFLAAREGVFCEPASAASVAGLLDLRRARRGRSGSSACSPATASRTRRPRSSRRGSVVPCDAELSAVERAIYG